LKLEEEVTKTGLEIGKGYLLWVNRLGALEALALLVALDRLQLLDRLPREMLPMGKNELARWNAFPTSNFPPGALWQPQNKNWGKGGNQVSGVRKEDIAVTKQSLEEQYLSPDAMFP
jgi:hypothetical protein